MLIIPQAIYAKALFDNKIVPVPANASPNVMAVVLKTVNDLLNTGTVTNKPAGADIAAAKVDHRADAASALADASALMNHQAAGSISLVFLGESHTNAADGTRAVQFIRATEAGAQPAQLPAQQLVYERGLCQAPPAGRNYPTPNGMVNPVLMSEEGLTRTPAANYGQSPDFGLVLSAVQRSQVVAGYLVLCVAGGNQQATDRILLLYGANHADILTSFDYIASHTSASYLLKRPRTFFSVRSNQA